MCSVVAFVGKIWYNRLNYLDFSGKDVPYLRKLISILLCAALLLAVLPGAALAAPDKSSAINKLIAESRQIYLDCLESAEKESFTGLCGLMASHQLWHMGVNSWLEVYDGNQQFDAYAAKEQTSGGYYVMAYPADTYTLEESLNIITQNGTRDAYDILVGFEWTNTEAGALYGHVVVINGIIDGTVYFVESYYTSLGGEEGNVIQCSIADFAAYFSDWMILDGVVHFSRNYSEGCQNFGTDVFVRTRFDSTLRSEPCLQGEHGCERLRSVSSGELLRATALLKNNENELFYKIQEGETVGYIAANAVSVVRLNTEDITLTENEIPSQLRDGKRLSLDGVVSAQNSNLDTLKVTVTDNGNNVILQANATANGPEFDLRRLDTQLAANLPQGAYTVTLQVQGAYAVARGYDVLTRYSAVELFQRALIVGDVQNSGQSRATVIPVLHGWHWDGNTWYYYQEGQPYTGWLEEFGVKYYFNDDGSVTTDWAEIDSVMRYFSPNGAMCVGWLTTDEGVSYRNPDGSAAEGLMTIGGRMYYFDESGFALTNSNVELDGVRYKANADGVLTIIE